MDSRPTLLALLACTPVAALPTGIIACPEGTRLRVEDSVHGPDTYAFCVARGVKEGPAVLVDETGAVRVRGQYREGRETGEFVHFTPAGAVSSSARYEDGRLDGVQRFYDESTGVLEWETTWADGLEQGPYRRYFPDGTVERVEWYEQGRPVGEHEEFWPGGRRRAVERYENGLANGVWEQWTEDGTLTRRETWRRGRLDGPVQAWHPNGRIAVEGQHVDGVARGPWVWFLDDGTLWHHADPEPCDLAERRLGAEIWAEPGSGAVYLRIEPRTWQVTGWFVAWRPYPREAPDPPYTPPPAWRDPAEIDVACLPRTSPVAWVADGLDAATIAAIDRAVWATAVPGAIALGGYFDGFEIARDGDAFVAIVRGLWLE